MASRSSWTPASKLILNSTVLTEVFWCVLEGIIAIALLLGGGLVAAQAATLATGLPFTLVLVAMCYSTWKGLRASTVGQGQLTLPRVLCQNSALGG